MSKILTFPRTQSLFSKHIIIPTCSMTGRLGKNIINARYLQHPVASEIKIQSSSSNVYRNYYPTLHLGTCATCSNPSGIYLNEPPRNMNDKKCENDWKLFSVDLTPCMHSSERSGGIIYYFSRRVHARDVVIIFLTFMGPNRREKVNTAGNDTRVDDLYLTTKP